MHISGTSSILRLIMPIVNLVVVVPLMFLCTEVIGLHITDNYRNTTRQKRDCPDDVGCNLESKLPFIPGRTNCVLPEYLENGVWKVFGGLKKQSGEIVPANTVLQFQCDPGFKLLPEAEYSVCNTRWNVMPICMKTCPSILSTELMMVGCSLYNTEISCKNPYEGTRARILCVPTHHDPSLKDQPYRNCNNGKWDGAMPQCQPVPETTRLSFIPSDLTSTCILPEHPRRGSWLVEGANALKPGNAVAQFTHLKYKCQRGFKLHPNINFSLCNNGWGDIPKCIKTCAPLKPTDAIHVSCFLDDLPTPCTDPADGTMARINCRPLYETISGDNEQYITCSDGSWTNPIPVCKPVCGLRSVDRRDTLNAKISKKVPWAAAILENGEYICGGSLISPNAVLTAAHCLLHPVGNYSITVGGDSENDLRQTVNIQEIIMHKNFKGHELNFENDIAAVVLEKAVKITKMVIPVCVDVTLTTSRIILNSNDTGYVWGWASENGVSRLKIMEVFHKTRVTCPVSKSFRVYMTPDKICATTHHEGDFFQAGISGGGLDYLNVDGRYYIRGIISVADTKGQEATNTALFSDISYYIDFLPKIFSQYV